jgi:hypothetical protein
LTGGGKARAFDAAAAGTWSLFEGGHAMYIGVGTVVVILLIVIIFLVLRGR